VTTAIIQSQQALETLLDVALTQTLKALNIHSGWVSLEKAGLSKQEQHIQILRGVLKPEETLFEAGRHLRKRAFDNVRKRPEATLESNVPLRIVTEDTPILCSSGYVPLSRDDKIVGILGVLSIHQRSQSRLSAEDIQLLRAIGNQISLAVKHTQLAQEAAQATQLRELDRLRSELIANFSHNLRSPLGIIEISCTTLLREDMNLSPETRNSLLNDIEAETNHLAQIVDGILDLGHFESQDLEPSKDRLCMVSLIERATDRMSNASNTHQIHVINTASQMEITGDPQRLEEVMVNLLDNAIKYSPQGGDVEVWLTNPDNDHVRVDVMDQGIGIPESELETIFERFYRVNNELTQQISGNGLGLAICEAIIKAHDGQIWAESALGYGTTVSIVLPLAA
jgi:K+-sensing histidine kinase KdpD